MRGKGGKERERGYVLSERERDRDRERYEYKDKNNAVVGDKQKRNYFREIQCRCERGGGGGEEVEERKEQKRR